MRKASVLAVWASDTAYEGSLLLAFGLLGMLMCLLAGEPFA
jgi:hypothetical protein